MFLLLIGALDPVDAWREREGERERENWGLGRRELSLE